MCGEAPAFVARECGLTLRSIGRDGSCLQLGERLVGAPVTFNVRPPMGMEALIEELVRYVAVLVQANHDTTRAEDRHAYTAHLAAAAELFLAAYQHDAAKVGDLLARERHAYGWGFLSDVPGNAVERAFSEFARFVKSANAA